MTMNLVLLIVLMVKELSNFIGKYQDFAMKMIKNQLVYQLIKKLLAEAVEEDNIKIRIIFVNIVRMVFTKNLIIYNLINLFNNAKCVLQEIMLLN